MLPVYPALTWVMLTCKLTSRAASAQPCKALLQQLLLLLLLLVVVQMQAKAKPWKELENNSRCPAGGWADFLSTYFVGCYICFLG